MPKDTFFNLAPEKKARLFAAISHEFSRKSFDDSAISEIIELAGIPRGSFYQYFADKLDCYLYFVGQIQNEQNTLYLTILEKTSGDLFEASKQFFKASITDVLEGSHSEFYQTMIEAHDFRLQRALGHGNMHQLIQKLYAQTDLSLLRINSFEEFRDLVSLMLNIFFKSVGSYFHNHSKKDSLSVATVQESCLKMLSWLQYGVVKIN
ncbi:TetR/AcrR family transcriptional regulator [Lactobacillus sp. UCMA15818]|uniref:TetR/AcrR family transcriptional regulator n=1 Tax=Lactobacillaceae TaxID=33958 RepID=UPI0025AF58B1|nr:TetR/AcrR family transcriptional regulator [Lactobacillus sp. UCMA15818]MDN2453979.1 TetR/AcrR family transcriptional regulator [Lactobacillus sp. UCMA15818]